MKPGKSSDVKEEIVEVHSSGRSPSPKKRPKSQSSSRSDSRKLSNGHPEVSEPAEIDEGASGDKAMARDNWIQSEQESLDTELPIHDQIKQGILGFVEKEIKKTDKPSFVFYSHDPNILDEKLMKTLSRPSSGHKEKRSPSYRRKKRHSSKHRDRDLHDFEMPGSSLSALERVDDYLKEYNKDEVVTLSGELDIEANDLENNNGLKDSRHKARKTRRKVRDERQESNGNGHDVSPKVFKTGNKSKVTKPGRPTNLTDMLDRLESNVSYHEQYIDNPFSSPSPLTSPNDERINPFGSGRPQKVYMQGGGTFKAVSRDRILESQQSKDDKYLRLDITSLDLTRGLQPYFQTIVLVILYMACLLVCTSARTYDELMVYQYSSLVYNVTANSTTPTIPTFYHTWTHFSIWRAVLSILGLIYFVIANPPDTVYVNMSKLLQFKHSLQSIG